MNQNNKNNLGVTVIMPALNEEKNIISAIESTLRTFKDIDINGEVLVINDGSMDKTEALVHNFIKKDKRIRMIKHDVPKGIGASFWDGVDNAEKDALVLLPGDNENFPFEILRYYKLLEHVDMVIPFIFNKEVRGLFRNILSFVYRFIVNSTFGVYFNYTNGTVLYRRSILKEIDHRSSSFFFQTDILVRMVKKGYLFAEVPYKLGSRKDGTSKAVSFPSLLQVIKGYLRLVRDYYFGNGKNDKGSYMSDSLTAIRKNRKSH